MLAFSLGSTWQQSSSQDSFYSITLRYFNADYHGEAQVQIENLAVSVMDARMPNKNHSHLYGENDNSATICSTSINTTHKPLEFNQNNYDN